MNISISSLSLKYGGNMHSCLFTNTLYRTFKIQKVFSSHSQASFFNSFGSKLAAFSLRKSYFNKYLDSIVSIRSNNNEKDLIMTVKSSTFTNIVTNHQGSALFNNYKNAKVFVSFCSFINCESKGSGNSNERTDGNVCGGTCMFSVGEIMMKSCSFDTCIGISLGSTLYISTPCSNCINISCLVDFNCGKDVTGTHYSIYACEAGVLNAKSMNSTNAISMKHHGVLHVGMSPEKCSLKYVSFIAKSTDMTMIPLGISLAGENYYGYVDYAYIANCKCSDGIITTYTGKYVFDHTIFDNCIGKLINKQGNEDLTFSNTIFCSSLTLTNFKTDDSCFITASVSNVLRVTCDLFGNTCINTCKTRPYNLAFISIICFINPYYSE